MHKSGLGSWVVRGARICSNVQLSGVCVRATTQSPSGYRWLCISMNCDMVIVYTEECKYMWITILKILVIYSKFAKLTIFDSMIRNWNATGRRNETGQNSTVLTLATSKTPFGRWATGSEQMCLKRICNCIYTRADTFCLWPAQISTAYGYNSKLQFSMIHPVDPGVWQRVTCAVIRWHGTLAWRIVRVSRLVADDLLGNGQQSSAEWWPLSSEAALQLRAARWMEWLHILIW